jgi:competence protein ComEC
MPRSGWLAVGACLGALSVAQDDRRVLGLLLLAIASATAAAWISPDRHRPVLALAVGVVAIVIRSLLGPAAAPLVGIPEGSGPWRMAVESVGSPRDGDQVATLRTIATDGSGFRLAANLPRYPTVEPGDRVEVSGRVRPRPDSPYGRYLERLGAWGTLDARSLALVERPTDPGTILEGWRRRAGDLLTISLPEPEAGLAAGILIGLRDRVDRDVAAAFTTAGVSHVVAISGWNIAIVAAAIAAIAGGIGRRRRAIVTAVAIAAYIAFAGASPSVLRAGAMAGVVLAARESGRSGRAAAALGWAIVVLLAVDPALVGDAGFQLSSLATAGLIAWATPLTARLDALTAGRLPRWLVETMGVSLAAQAATLPVVLAAFGRLALIAPAINLLVVPLVAPAMAAGLVALVGGLAVGLGAPPALGALLAVPGWVALRLMIGLVRAAAGLPMASVAFEPAVGAGVGVGSAVVVGLVLAWRQRRRGRAEARGGARASNSTTSGTATLGAGHGATSTGISGRSRSLALALAAAVVVSGGVVVSRPAGVARISILDVGQGDAILVEGSRGGRLLVDGGPDPDRLLVELDRRLPPWDRRIDVVILSHPHEDHVAGLALLLARYRVGRVLEPGMRGPGPGYAAWSARLIGESAPQRAGIAAGDRLTVDDISMIALWPIRGRVPSEPTDTGTGINNVSVVLLGTIGDRRFLLAGDVEQDIDPRLLADGLPRLDLLKVAHHGSRTATTQPFVDTVRPVIAVASAGVGNPYGHPARTTMDRLTAAGARVYRTDRDGTVTVTFAARGLTVRVQPRDEAAAARPGSSAAPAIASVDGRGLNGPRPFLCGIPLTAAQARASTGRVPPRPSEAAAARQARPLGYHRDDDRSRPDRRGCPALVPGSADVVRRARASGRRGGRLPRPADRREGHRRGPCRGRGGRSAARRRQDPALGRSGPDPPPRLRFGRLADRAGPSGTGPPGRRPSRDPPCRRRCLSTLGGVRQPRGARHRVRRQAGRSTPRVDGCAVRLVAAPLPGRLGRRDLASGPQPGSAARDGGVPGGRHRAGRRRPPGVDRRRPAGRSRRGLMVAPVLYIWGDDELVAERLVARFATALAADLGAPLERWDLPVTVMTAAADAARLHERLATATMFGGGTLAVVANPGPLTRRNDLRDRTVATLASLAAGNAVVFVEASRSSAKGPGSKRLSDAVGAAGGRIVGARAPQPASLGSWIEAEARERGIALASGAARDLAERLGSRVTEGDVDRRSLSRIASTELDKLALRHALDGGPITTEDVRDLVAETTPSSVWALTDAVGLRRADAATDALERLLVTTPEPVILAALHRRVRDLIEVSDRFAAGQQPADVVAATGLHPYVAEKMQTQGRLWSLAELRAALEGLVELDAMVKGAPGSEAGLAQRRLAFTLWVRDHATRPARSVGPG